MLRTTEKSVDLDDREHGELIGALQIARDRLREQGYTGDGVQAVLLKLYELTGPGTAGLRITELVISE